MSFACSDAMRCGPTLVVLSECKDDSGFRGIVEVSLTGHGGMTTAHTSGPAATVGRMCLAAPPDQRDGFASEIITALHMVVHQRLIPAKEGGRIGVREFLIYDSSVRSSVLNKPYEKWREIINGIMADADGVYAQRFDQALARLLERDQITKAVYDERMIGLQTVGVI